MQINNVVTLSSVEKYFLPFYFKYIGFISMLGGLLSGYLVLERHYMPDFLDVPVFAIHSQYVKKTVMGMSQTNIMDEIALILTISGLLLMMFSKQKNESLEIMGLRVTAIFSAVITNSLFIVFATLFIFGIGFVKVVFLNLFSLPIIYLIIFNALLLKMSKKEI